MFMLLVTVIIKFYLNLFLFDGRMAETCIVACLLIPPASLHVIRCYIYSVAFGTPHFLAHLLSIVPYFR